MARRVNTRFLIVLTAIVVGLVVAVVVAQKVFMRDDPQEFVDAAKRLTEEKKYDAALKNMRQAVQLDQRRADLWVLYGDAAARLVGKDFGEYGRTMLGAWSKALEIDPLNKEALSRMTDFHVAQAEAGALSARMLSDGRAHAQKLAQVDPTNVRAQTAAHTLTIRAYAAGVQTEPQRVEEAIAKLTEFAQKDPANPDLPYHVAQAKFVRAQELARLGQTAEADKLYAEAGAVMDAAVAAQPENAGMQFRHSQVLAAQAGGEKTPEARAKYEPRVKAAIAAAKQHVKPDDRYLTDIHLAASNIAQQERDPERAEKVLRELLTIRPGDQMGRIQLAQLLAATPARRGEAVELLEKPLEIEGLPFDRSLQVQSLETNTLAALADLRLDMHAAATDPAAKQQEMAKFDEAYSKLVARTGDDKFFALRLRGKQQRLQGKHIEAIQTLNRAKSQMDQMGQTRSLQYYDVINMLARSYAETEQSGTAKQLLTQVVERYENDPGSRLLLAQLLLQERNLDAARPHIEALEKRLPDHPEVVKMRMRILDPVKERPALLAAFAKLPEKTKGEILDKANTAQAIGESDQALRLLEGMRAKDPNDVDVTAVLARVYHARNEKEKGIALLNEALKTHPDHQGLRLLLGRLAEETPDQLRQARREMIAKVEDPFVRAMQLADLAREESNAAEWLKQLKAAEQLKPNEPKVREGLFAYHVSQRQWDQAQPILETMARANQDQAGGLLFRFRFARAKGDTQAALTHARELTEKMPEFSTSWLSLGEALQDVGQHEEATQRFVTALEKQNDNADAIRGLIESYIALNRPSDAKRYIDQGSKSFPNHPAFKEMQVVFEMQFGDPEKALPARQDAVVKRPEDVKAWLALGQTYTAVARAKLAKQDKAAAEENFTKARETLTQAAEKFPDERRAYALLAEVAVATKRFEDAETVLKQFATREAWQDKPDPGLLLAEVYARGGKMDQATSTLRVLSQKFPDNVDVQLALASALAQSGNAKDAIAALTAEHPRVLRQRLELLAQSGQLDEANKQIDAALSKTPNAVDLLAFAGYINMNRNQWDEAVRRLRQALDVEPKNQMAQYYLAMVRMRQPQPDLNEAIKLLTAVRDQNPRFTDARFLLAQAHQQRNDVDNAARELEAALQNEPNNKTIRLTLAQLYSGAARWIEAERVLRTGREIPQFANDLDLLRAEMLMWVARKDYPKAIERLKQALAASPNNPQLVNDQVNILLEAKDFKSVVAVTDQLLSADKNLVWALQARAIAKRNLNDKDGAIADFEAALAAANAQRSDESATNVVRTMASEIGVDEALQRVTERAKTENRWRLVAAYLYQTKGDAPAAAEMIERTLAEYDKLTPGEKEAALRFAGALYLSMQPQRVEKAHDAYVKLLQLQPNDLSSLNNMACLLAESMTPPRPQEAIQYSTRAYDLMMNAGVREPMIMDTQGWVLTLNGQVDKGIDVLRQAVATRSFPDAHYHLAEAYLKKSYPEEAQKQLDMAAQHVNQAKEKKQQFDPTLEAKIQDAQARAKEMIRAKSEAKVP